MKTNGKKHFTQEFEINARAHEIYELISTPDGLSQWFADKITLNENGRYVFTWGKTSYSAEMIDYRKNVHIRYKWEGEKEQFLDFRISVSPVSGTLFLRVIDSMDTDDPHEQAVMWNSAIQTLKNLVEVNVV